MLPAGVSPGLLAPPITPVPNKIARTNAARPKIPSNAIKSGLQQTESFLASEPKLPPGFGFLFLLSSSLSAFENDFL